jgi:hypothetical protein
MEDAKMALLDRQVVGDPKQQSIHDPALGQQLI